MEYHSETNKKPRASSWRWTSCAHCSNAHLLLLDENDKPFADMTLSAKQADSFVLSLGQVLVHIAIREETQ